jgi:hypothetical protein
LFGDCGNVFGQVAQRPRAIAIGADAKRVGPLELQQVADLVKDIGNLLVGHVYSVPERR